MINPIKPFISYLVIGLSTDYKKIVYTNLIVSTRCCFFVTAIRLKKIRPAELSACDQGTPDFYVELATGLKKQRSVPGVPKAEARNSGLRHSL